MLLVRFDDICPTMNWDIWDQIEVLLYDLNIKPILAVIPDNQDTTLRYCEERVDFWDRVRQWQEWNWSIGMHGYQHLYVTANAGLLDWSPYSEFTGLEYEKQKKKLDKAMAIFRRERIEPCIWVAPAHSFDELTVHILKKIGIYTISDGLSFQPYIDKNNMLWVPVQVSKFRKSFSFFTWTICLHHNTWTQNELVKFRRDVTRFRSDIKSLDDVLSTYGERRYSLADVIFRYLYKYALRVRQIQQKFIAGT